MGMLTLNNFCIQGFYRTGILQNLDVSFLSYLKTAWLSLSRREPGEEGARSVLISQNEAMVECTSLHENIRAGAIRMVGLDLESSAFRSSKRMFEEFGYGRGGIFGTSVIKTIFGSESPSKAAIFDEVQSRSFYWCRYRCKAILVWIDA
ncbi:hypothetical protein Tco_0958068 [Tanacetum coccineum]